MTRSTTVATRAISNALFFGKDLNIVQPKRYPISTYAITARASREVQYDAQQREAARVRALRRRHQKLDDLVNIAEAIRISAPTCDVNAHLDYATATIIDV